MKMKSENTLKRNLWMYALKEGAYNAAMPMINGALIQLFLADKGLSSAQIGLFNAITYFSVLGSMVFLSETAERQRDPLHGSAKVIFLQAILYIGLFPAMLFKMQITSIFLLTMLIGILQMVLNAIKGIWEYKIPYQIIPLDQYGALMAFAGVMIGVIGIASNYLLSVFIKRGTGGNPYFLCAVITFGLLFFTFWCNRRLLIVNDAFKEYRQRRNRTKELLDLLHSPVFNKFIVPNLLRGITLGITNSMALLALAMGIEAASVAKIPLMFSIGYVAASLLYYILSRWMPLQAVGLLGAGLLCVIIFLPEGNSVLFLAFTFAAYMGRVVVDFVIPEMVFKMIDPQTSGVYNAWRNILSNVATMITIYVMGLVVDKIHPAMILIPCAAAYVISMIWYCVLYHFFR